MEMNKRFVIHVSSIKGLEYSTMEHEYKNGLIACSSRPVQMKKDIFFNNFCAVTFADVSSPDQHGAMQDGHARIIRDYILGLSDEITDLYICCDSGESRSPAIVAAILTVSGLSDACIWENPYYTPNALVYQRVCSAFGMHISDAVIARKKWNNRQAYRSAQKKHGACAFSRWQSIDMKTMDNDQTV